MITPAQHLLIEFILEKSPGEPRARRAALYRAVVSDLPETDPNFLRLTRLADDLEDIDRRQAELALEEQECAAEHEQLLLELRQRQARDGEGAA